MKSSNTYALDAERGTASKLLMVWEKLHCHIAFSIQFWKVIFSFGVYMPLYYQIDFRCYQYHYLCIWFMFIGCSRIKSNSTLTKAELQKHLFWNSSAFAEMVKKRRETAERLSCGRKGHVDLDDKKEQSFTFPFILPLVLPLLVEFNAGAFF